MKPNEIVMWKEYWVATLRIRISVTAQRTQIHAWVIGSDDWVTGVGPTYDLNQAEVSLLGQLGCM